MSDKKIIIASDSTTDLGDELIAKYDIKILPLNVTLGDKTFRDGVDITPDEIYDYHSKTGVLPKTSAINAAEFTDFFKQYTDQGYAVVMFVISSGMSATFQNANIAASELDDVYVVDTKNLSTGGGHLVLRAAELREQGKSAKEIADACNELTEYVDASFVIDNLEYLHKGGRCSAVAALGANLLKLKPLIQVKDSKMGVAKKYRGNYSVVLKEYVKDKLANGDDIVLDHVFVTHAGCDREIVDSVVNAVKSALPFKNVYITRASCTISSHCGRNTLGVLFIRKSKLS